MDWFSIIGYIVGVGGGLIALMSRRNKDNNSAGTELIDKLEKLRLVDKEDFDKRLKAMEGQRNECANKIASLQGQIDTLKNVPLGNIDATLVEIRDTLKKSAVVLALDTESAASEVKATAARLGKDDTAKADTAEIVRLTLLKSNTDTALAAALVKTTLAESRKK